VASSTRHLGRLIAVVAMTTSAQGDGRRTAPAPDGTADGMSVTKTPETGQQAGAAAGVISAAGHDSPGAVAEWAACCSQATLAVLGGRGLP